MWQLVIHHVSPTSVTFCDPTLGTLNCDKLQPWKACFVCHHFPPTVFVFQHELHLINFWPFTFRTLCVKQQIPTMPLRHQMNVKQSLWSPLVTITTLLVVLANTNCHDISSTKGRYFGLNSTTFALSFSLLTQNESSCLESVEINLQLFFYEVLVSIWEIIKNQQLSWLVIFHFVSFLETKFIWDNLDQVFQDLEKILNN